MAIFNSVQAFFACILSASRKTLVITGKAMGLHGSEGDQRVIDLVMLWGFRNQERQRISIRIFVDTSTIELSAHCRVEEAHFGERSRKRHRPVPLLP